MGAMKEKFPGGEEGFRSFKLQGRGDSSQCMLYDLTRYLLEPEVAAPLIFKACSPEK